MFRLYNLNRLRNNFVHLRLWFCKSNRSFCHDTRWMLRIYQFMGLLPISKGNNGRYQFKVFSSIMLYSFIMYIALTTLCIHNVFIDRLYTLMTLVNDFDSFIYNLMFLSFMKAQFFYAIGGWFSAKQIANYHNNWTDFERNYLRKLKEPLVMNFLESLTNRLVLICIFLAWALILGQLLLLPTYTLLEAIGYIPTALGFFIHIALIHLNCAAIKKASDQLLNNFKVSLTSSPVTQDVIKSYKCLWFDLTNITQSMGNAYFNYSIIMILAAFIDIIISGYGFLSRYILRIKLNTDMTVLTSEEVGLINATIISSFLIVHSSNFSYLAVSKVEETFIDVLCDAATKPHHPKVVKEIDMFLLTVKNNPPVISLGGYIDLNREFIMKVYSTIISYLVVMMQFKVGISADP